MQFTHPSVKVALDLSSVIVSLCLVGCHVFPQDREAVLRAEMHSISGRITLPPGVTELHMPLEFERGAHDIELRGDASGSILRLAKDFKGRAAILGVDVQSIKLEDFRIIGERTSLIRDLYLPPSDVTFADYYTDNGILFLASRSITIREISLQDIGTFPILLSRCHQVKMEGIQIADSGTLNSLGHSNSTGGILLEEGTTDFSVKNCHVANICGNAIWTHSNYRSPRNADGVIVDNEIWGTPRDAIQVGHATRVQVQGNRGGRIGFPPEEADLPGGATPVALDSSGDTSESIYSGNHFEDVDGQCIDLDGFHDGRVVDNVCLNQKPTNSYPLSHVGIVFGNSNPDMRSRAILVSGNQIEGFGYGGIYLIGEGHEITNNRFVNVNRNHCSGDMRIPRCNYAPEEPDMLRSGVYLASHAARPAETKGNKILGNFISGFGMDHWCIRGGPSVRLDRNIIRGNRCVSLP